MGNLFYRDTPEAGALSRELRSGEGRFLGQRRAIVALSIVASGAMSLITLYQMGMIRRLPEPPLPHLNADLVDAAPEAYRLFSTPDGTLGLAGYAGTTVLAAMGGESRAISHPWIPLAMAAKLLLDVLASTKLTLDQWTKHRAFCFWCLLATVTTFASAILAVPETRTAWRALRETQDA